MSSIADLGINLYANIAGFVADLGKAQREADKRTAAMVKTFKALGGALVGVVSFGAIIKGLDSAITKMDKLGDSAKKLNVGTETLSALGYAAQQSGSNFETLEQGLTKLAQNLSLATKEGSLQAEIFSKLGIAVTDATGAIRPLDVVLVDVAEKFKGYKDGAEEVAIASNLLGKSAGPQLVQFLNEGKDGIEKLKEEAEGLGLALSGNTVSAAQQFNDRMDSLKAQVSGLFVVIANQLIPTITPLVQLLSEAVKETTSASNGFNIFKVSIEFVTRAFVALKNAVEVVAASIGLIVNTITGAKQAFGGFVSGLKGIYEAQKLLVTGDVQGALKAYTDGMREYGKESEGAANKIKSGFQSFKDSVGGAFTDVVASANKFLEPLKQVVVQTEESTKKNKENAPSIGAIKTQMEAARKAATDQEQAIKALREESVRFNESIDDLAAELGGPVQQAISEYNKKLEEAFDLYQRGGISLAQFDRAQKILYDDLNKNIDEAGRESREYLESIRDMSTELQGPAAKAWRDYAKAIEEAKSKLSGNELTEALTVLRARLQTQLREAQADADSEFLDAQKQTVDEYNSIWSSGINSVADAFGDFVASGLKDFKSFKDSLKNIAKQIVSELVSFFIKQKIVIPLVASLAGGGGVLGGLGALAGGGGGIFGGLLGGATGSGGGLFGGLLGGLGGFAGGLGTGLGGFVSSIGTQGLFGALGSSFSGGLAALGGGQIGLGIGSLLGPIGLAVGAASLINKVTGGGLFGTSFASTGGGSNIGFGAGGITGESFETQSRKRSLFRGTQRRTVTSALDSELLKEMQDFFKSVSDAMTQAASALGVDVPEKIAGSFKQTFDKNGKLKDEISTVLGRTYKEGLEDFKKRVLGENILATITTSLAQMGSAGDEANKIAEKWRSSASTLLDGAQFLLQAQQDIKNGRALLGDTATLTATTELAERLQKDGETLLQTYARLSGATAILDDAVAYIGVTFEKTREQFIEFADGIVEAAGGLQEAQELWSAYFDQFFTEAERAQKQFDEANMNAERVKGELGITGDVNQGNFRQQFEAALPMLSPEEVVKWLQLGRYIAIATEASQRMAGAAAQVAESTNSAREALEEYSRNQAEIGDIIKGLAEEVFVGGLTDMERAVYEINQRIDEMIARAIELNATQEQLAQIEGYRNQLLDQATRSNSDFAQSIGDVRNAGRSATDEILEMQERIRGLRDAARGVSDFLREQIYGTSSASPIQRIQAAQAEFRRLITSAAAGSTEAVSALPGAAQQLLQQVSSFFGVGSEQFRQIEAYVRNVLSPFNDLATINETSVNALPTALGLLRDVLDRLNRNLENRPWLGGGGSNRIGSNEDVDALIIRRLEEIRDAVTRSSSEISSSIDSSNGTVARVIERNSSNSMIRDRVTR
jgi:hypothetical protein